MKNIILFDSLISDFKFININKAHPSQLTLLHLQIQPVLFFPKIVIKVAHLLAAELEHLVMEVFVVASDKAVG